jgi:hypothetical protein
MDRRCRIRKSAYEPVSYRSLQALAAFEEALRLDPHAVGAYLRILRHREKERRFRRGAFIFLKEHAVPSIGRDGDIPVSLPFPRKDGPC